MLYGKIGHLPGSRTGPSDRHVAQAARFTSGDGRVLVEEKLDGTCVLVERRGHELLALGREGRPCRDSRNEGRRAFAAWVEASAHRFAWLADGWRVAGEWLVLAHGTRYALPHGPFVAFDLFTPQRQPRRVLSELVRGTLPQPHLLYEGAPIGVDAALALLGERGHHGALEAAEGVVYRLESSAPIALAKYVRHGKRDGIYLADHSGAGHVWNTWHDDGP